MIISYQFLVIIDFVPEPPSEEVLPTVLPTTVADASINEVVTENEAEITTPKDPTLSAKPERIIVDRLGIDVAVFNPDTLDMSALDEVLLNGVARHPLSADFVNQGNILIFGHSSYLPHVFNSNFQAFNGVQDLTWGDRIRLQSADSEYQYRVDRVYQVKATETAIENGRDRSMLTIITCNSFATTDDRYVIEATLVSEPLPLESDSV